MLLIIGGMGFIGMHTTRHALDAGEDVVLGVHSSRREPDLFKDEIGKRVHIATVDVTNPLHIVEAINKYGVTRIAHMVAPRLGSLSPGDEYRTNMLGLINVFEAARVSGVERVLVASSQSVYLGLKQGPFLEDAPLPVATTNATEAYKKSFETLGSLYANQTGVSVVFMRIGSIYGPLYYSGFNLPSRMTRSAVTSNPPDYGRGGVPFSDDSTDWTYVKDVSKGVQLLAMADSLSHTTYNIGSGMGTTNQAVAEAISAAAPGVNFELQPGKSPSARPDPFMDNTRIREEVGYEPKYTIGPAIAEYVEWMRATPDWR